MPAAAQFKSDALATGATAAAPSQRITLLCAQAGLIIYVPWLHSCAPSMHTYVPLHRLKAEQALLCI